MEQRRLRAITLEEALENDEYFACFRPYLYFRRL